MKRIKLEYLLLFLILLFSAFFRLFRLNLLLGFWYDQGRDALVIWDLIHYHKFFLIGPVTGIGGIFLGPFYYYLLTPFYLLGKGNPVTAAAAIQWMTIGAVFLIYLIGKKIFNKEIGLIAAFLYGFSYLQIAFSRWLANPAPLPFFALLIVLFLYEFINGRKNFLILALFLTGLCLQLEAASATFFLPSILLILIWQRKKLNFKLLFLSFIAFFVTLLPQVYFNFRHEGILVLAFKKFLIEEKSFKVPFGQILLKRLLTYYDVFTNKIFPPSGLTGIPILALFSAGLIFFHEKIFDKKGKFLLTWLFVPLVCYLFYQGNHGYIWDYYFAGIIPVFFILLSVSLFYLFKKNSFGKILVGVFLFVFFLVNLNYLRKYYVAGIGITLGAQKKAIDWIYKEAGSNSFNADFYVPPQIYYSYSYLVKWYGGGKYGREPETKQVKELYTLYEPDREHPQFLKAWLERQDGIGKIYKEYFWGDITVQKRERILYDD